MQTTRLKLHWMSKIADILLRNMNDLFTMHSCTAFMFNVTSNTARFWSLNYASWLSSLQWPYHQYVFDTKIEKYKCSEVTRKNEMNKCKRQSALLRPSRHFLLTILNLNIPALSFCQRTPRDLSKKKELYAEAQHALSQTNARNWALPNYFLSCPPHSAWAAETSVSVSVTDFHNQLKINDQCSSKPWWTKK